MRKERIEKEVELIGRENVHTFSTTEHFVETANPEIEQEQLQEITRQARVVEETFFDTLFTKLSTAGDFSTTIQAWDYVFEDGKVLKKPCIFKIFVNGYEKINGHKKCLCNSYRRMLA